MYKQVTFKQKLTLMNRLILYPEFVARLFLHCDIIIEYDTFFYILQCMRKLLRCYESGHVVYSWVPYLYEGLLESISRRFLFSESSDKSSSTGATWRIRQNNQYCTTLVYSFTKTALSCKFNANHKDSCLTNEHCNM